MVIVDVVVVVVVVDVVVVVVLTATSLTIRRKLGPAHKQQHLRTVDY